jgi:hypothetical protein
MKTIIFLTFPFATHRFKSEKSIFQKKAREGKFDFYGDETGDERKNGVEQIEERKN